MQNQYLKDLQVPRQREMSFHAETGEDVSEPQKTFSAADYAVFASELAICSGVGLYFGYKDLTKSKTRRLGEGNAAFNFLLGGQKLQIFPGSVVQMTIRKILFN